MDVKEAVNIAKDYVRNLFQDEKLFNLGLEEVEFDQHMGHWNVTLGFSRPWDTPNGLVAVTSSSVPRRSFKVVTISDKDEKVKSVRDRENE